ncbi:thiopurine S-methyltransferase [Pseudomonas sp. NPDC090202]|uniref:thiopurine S-methyltransferase n=1 Tax=unclassified Pseudomonas TaxID=196821 RepID=UPI0038025DDD
MEPQFWHERWAVNQIGFHQSDVNPYLKQFWPELNLKAGERVLVPLCGKSIDMTWLEERGFAVVGIELSEKAVEDYFKERRVKPEVEQRGAFKVYRHAACEIWCGDFFALKARDIGNCSALYDRAALIALPAEMRWRYVKQLNSILPADCRGLLITLDYEQSEIDGPPFAVPEEEVMQLLSPEWRLNMIAEQDVLAQSRKFVEAGASRLSEHAYRMFRR